MHAYLQNGLCISTEISNFKIPLEIYRIVIYMKKTLKKNLLKQH